MLCPKRECDRMGHSGSEMGHSGSEKRSEFCMDIPRWLAYRAHYSFASSLPYTFRGRKLRKGSCGQDREAKTYQSCEKREAKNPRAARRPYTSFFLPFWYQDTKRGFVGSLRATSSLSANPVGVISLCREVRGRSWRSVVGCSEVARATLRPRNTPTLPAMRGSRV